MSGIEQDLFAEAMGGKVQPLKASAKTIIKKRKPPRPLTHAATGSTITNSQLLPANAQTVQATDKPWQYIADGVSKEKIKRLAQGRPAPALTFDLHGMTRDAALQLLQDGLQQAMRENCRALCVIHGRGLHSPGPPVLKQAVYHCLREGRLAPIILAVIPQPGSGGGACLILLRRNKQ